MQERSGYAKIRPAAGAKPEVYLQLDPGESCILQTSDKGMSGLSFDCFQPAGPPVDIKGTWTVAFVSGGPELPPAVKTDRLSSWTEFGGEVVKKFSGTATYAVTFPKPAGQGPWLLDLGRVRESARASVNGKPIGAVIGPSYRIRIDAGLLRESNTLEIKVTNLMANRIADMDRRRVPWKKFYNVNFPANRAENRGAAGLFDASKWQPMESGLIGPVTLTPLRVVIYD
jgi:hypothetical protein